MPLRGRPREAAPVGNDLEEFLVAELEKAPDLAIFLIGHSYGGDAAYQVADRLSRAGVDVGLLVTIDPVSRSGSRGKPARVRQWVNVHADPAVTGRCNDVADLGGRWGAAPGADFNRFGAGLDHCKVLEMFGLVKDRVRQAMKAAAVNADERKQILGSPAFRQYVNGLGRTPEPGRRNR